MVLVLVLVLVLVHHILRLWPVQVETDEEEDERDLAASHHGGQGEPSWISLNSSVMMSCNKVLLFSPRWQNPLNLGVLRVAVATFDEPQTSLSMVLVIGSLPPRRTWRTKLYPVSFDSLNSSVIMSFNKVLLFLPR